MAVQAQYLDAHAFRHDPRAIRPELGGDAKGGASSVFLADPAASGGHLLAQLLQTRGRGGNTVFSDPRSELTCNNNNDNHHGSDCFAPRKRARVGDAGAVMDHGYGGALIPTAPVPQALAAAGADVQRRAHGSGAASTSGRPATAAPPVASQGLLSQLHHHGVDIDAIVRTENERLRAGLEDARRRHLRAVVSALERAAARRVRAAEADLERALARGAELEERLRQMAAEGQAWRGIASSHEAAAAGLRATLDQLLQPPQCAGAEVAGAGEAEDAQSCCFREDRDRAAGRDGTARACRACGEAEACVLLLPCRHLCLCAGCEAAADACPVCAAAKNASLHVLLA